MDCKVGIGSGSTIVYAVEHLGKCNLFSWVFVSLKDKLLNYMYVFYQMC